MIICEECGARNRNGAYVCAQCGAGLLHLEATEDSDAASMKPRAGLFGRKARPADDALLQFEDEEAEEALRRGEEDLEPISEDENAEPGKSKRPLFGRKAKPEGAATGGGTEHEPEQEGEPEENGPGQTTPMAGEAAGSQWVPDQEPEPLSLTENEPESNTETDAVHDAPGDEPRRLEPEADQTQNMAYEAHVEETIRNEDGLPEDEEAPASITIDMDTAVFDADSDVEYEDEDDDDAEYEYDDDEEYDVEDIEGNDKGTEESDGRIDYKTAYQTRRRDSDRMTRGMIAAIITVSSLLVVTLVVLGVLLISRNNRSSPVIATMAPVETAVEPSPTAAEMPVPTMTQTPEDDLSSVFEQPDDMLINEP